LRHFGTQSLEQVLELVEETLLGLVVGGRVVDDDVVVARERARLRRVLGAEAEVDGMSPVIPKITNMSATCSGAWAFATGRGRAAVLITIPSMRRSATAMLCPRRDTGITR
jgi:hypothetical protein